MVVSLKNGILKLKQFNLKVGGTKDFKTIRKAGGINS